MTLSNFNDLKKEDAKERLLQCCGSLKWATLLVDQHPFALENELINKSITTWYDDCTQEDWLEAFTHHPKIGDLKSLEQKFAATKALAEKEQVSIKDAAQNIIETLADANKEYEEKFGFIFIVCATGKTAVEMLRLLQDRLSNTYEEELMIAMGEQQKITTIRIKKLISKGDWDGIKNSQLTTHVLDTSIGKPGNNISIRLQQINKDHWQTFAQGITDNDGRIQDLLPPQRMLVPGIYKLLFETAAYYKRSGSNAFYPAVEIQFTISDDQHYHVPLLLNPFGYSTYRGS